MKIKRIVQKDDTGCGIACAAMFANQPYSEVKQLFTDQIFKKPKHHFGTSHRELEQALHLLGFFTKRRRFRGWHNIETCAIVAVCRSKHRSDWHWVVFVRRGNEKFVIDPMPSYRTYIRDFRLVRGSGIYIEVHGCDALAITLDK